MNRVLHWQTVDPILLRSLHVLMKADEFMPFRLVGGTSLSLQLGHRISVDIDLFTDAAYGTINFETIDHFLTLQFPYIDASFSVLPGMGRSYIIGNNKDEAIKLDVYYTDTFIQPPLIIENVRMATIEEIIAMKVDVLTRGGRKKDFWDLHELMEKYSIAQMIALHKVRYPYGHNETSILSCFADFTNADDDFEPICQRGKHWEIVKLDFIEGIENME